MTQRPVGGGPYVVLTLFCLAMALFFAGGFVYFTWMAIKWSGSFDSAEDLEKMMTYSRVRNASILFAALSLLAGGFFVHLTRTYRRSWKAISRR
ncbi:MAG: hypothetical protein ACYSX0_21270 [Planctomycetota bacterium]